MRVETAGRRGGSVAEGVSNGDQFDAYIDWFFDRGARLRAAIDPAASHILGP
jgi:hypothetical protein